MATFLEASAQWEQSKNSPGAVTEEEWILGIPEESQAVPDLEACFIHGRGLFCSELICLDLMACWKRKAKEDP